MTLSAAVSGNLALLSGYPNTFLEHVCTQQAIQSLTVFGQASPECLFTAQNKVQWNPSIKCRATAGLLSVLLYSPGTLEFKGYEANQRFPTTFRMLTSSSAHFLIEVPCSLFLE